MKVRDLLKQAKEIAKHDDIIAGYLDVFEDVLYGYIPAENKEEQEQMLRTTAGFILERAKRIGL